MENVM